MFITKRKNDYSHVINRIGSKENFAFMPMIWDDLLPIHILNDVCKEELLPFNPDFVYIVPCKKWIL